MTRKVQTRKRRGWLAVEIMEKVADCRDDARIIADSMERKSLTEARVAKVLEWLKTQKLLSSVWCGDGATYYKMTDAGKMILARRVADRMAKRLNIDE